MASSGFRNFKMDFMSANLEFSMENVSVYLENEYGIDKY